MENRFDCGICSRSFKVLQARGHHYLEDHGDQWLAVLFAKWDGVVQEEQVNQPMVPLRALPRVAPPRDAVTPPPMFRVAPPRDSVTTPSPMTTMKTAPPPPIIGPLDSSDSRPSTSSHGKHRVFKVPRSGTRIHDTVYSQKRKLDTSNDDEVRRVVIIKNIPGWLTTEEFCERFIPPFGTVYRDIDVFYSVTNQDQSTSTTALTTAQIEFYTPETAVEFRDWFMMVKHGDGFQLVAELAENMIQMPPIQGPKKLKYDRDEDVENADDRGTLFVIIQGAPPEITLPDVLNFFHEDDDEDAANLQPIGVDILRDEETRCNGTILCKFENSKQATKAATLFHQTSLNGQEVSISLISKEDKIRIISRWELGPIPVATLNPSWTPMTGSERVGKSGTVVLLGNIPYKATKEQIHQHVQYVLGVPFNIQQIDMRLQQDGVHGTGAVHLIMETMAEAHSAKEKLENTVLMNRYLRTTVRYNL